MSIRANYPDILPSLNLDFANTKKLDPRITFTRTTTATYYDGVTVAKAEENLMLRSQEFDNGNWSKTNSSISADNTTAPDGTTTADKIVETAANDIHYISNVSNLPAKTTTYTFSIFAKKGERDWCQLYIWNNSTSIGAYFDLTNGVIGTTDAGITASISSVGNGWFRCAVTRTSTFDTGSGPGVVIATADNTRSYAGDITKGIYIWGAQLEQRSAVSSYTATTTQAITNYIPVLQTAASGQARFDHNPTTGESLGLLIEEQRANTFTYSSDFGNAAWGKSNASISDNVIIAPDGTLTGDLITLSGINGYARQVFGTTAGVVKTLSVFAKQATGSTLRIGSDQIGDYGVFNLSNGTITSGTNTTIQSVGNGWYRCTKTMTDNTTLIGYQIGGTTSGDTFYIWGAQLETGSFATSYIPTTSATVTRNADAASMTGTNFSSWYRADEGTVYTEINPKALAASNGVTINDNTTSNRIRVTTNSTSDQSLITTGGTAQATLDGGTPAASTTMKLATAYKVNDFALSLNAGTVATDTGGTVPVVNQLQIGSETTTAGNLTIKKVSYYPVRVTNAELQGLTS